MALILAGIDEAGYGPMLGPLCVGAAVFRVEGWEPDGRAPDLWDLLSSGVCRRAGDRHRRVAVEDSKRLKLPNSSATLHPLTHLERGVLAFLGAAGARPATDLALFGVLGSACEPHAWYAGDPRPLPVAHTPDQLAIAANEVARAMHAAGVSLAALRCRMVGETAFNDVVAARGTKAAATEAALGALVRGVWERWSAEAGQDAGGPRIVCDRQGGRTDYAPVLARIMAGTEAEIVVLEESARCCRYLVREAGAGGNLAAGRRATVLFLTEAEGRHLPVALASMTAKYVRELAMARFNAYWCGLCPELKPTAGYTQDARRWLREAMQAGVLDGSMRQVLVRRA
jgi:ribonuclease HII